ncbi:MAG: hypothetical protein JF616_00670, partial [Fibrobacteres bacterium]|nr:hypothetical protein [Fibrobacterota bacterium]
MNPISATTAKASFSWTPNTISQILGSGLAASIPAVLIAAIAVEAVPHVRGLSYFTELRYAVTTPICILIAIAGAAFYRVRLHRSARPRVALALAFFAIALMVLAMIALFGGQSLTLAALPAVLSVATVLSLLVPRSVEVPHRSRFRIAAIALFSALEIWGAEAAFSSEKAAPIGAAGLAFDIPRTLFDADHKFLTLSNGARIHFVDEGKGEVLLFLHGNPAWSFQWRE